MADINSILSKTHQSFVSPARFAVGIYNDPVGIDNSLLANRCVRASLPGRSFSTHDLLLGSAPMSKVAYRATYTGSLSLTFRLDPEFKLRTMFEDWHDEIYDSDGGTFKMYNDYTAGMTVGVYDSDCTKLIYECSIYRVYPVSINQVDLSADSQNAYATQSVEFAYNSWKKA